MYESPLQLSTNRTTRLTQSIIRRLTATIGHFIFLEKRISLILALQIATLSIKKHNLMIQLQFQGAARTVTGSMHMLTVGGKTVLLDCGIYHGRRQEAHERNSRFPFDPSSIAAVILSHAHIDHSGNLPGLVRQGFRGPIYATHATKSLCEVMLKDSAHIQERDAEFITKRHKAKGLPPVEPLYTQEDVENTLPLFQGTDYSRTFTAEDGIECRFEDAGHILGSASLALSLRENSHSCKLVFTGDLGRSKLPILRDPVFVGGDTDYLISESTYGGRFHAPVEDMEDQLLEPLRKAYDRKGKVVIPAFSVGRTQEIVYVLHTLSNQGKIDRLPIFVDSPLSVNVTDVFRRHPECYDKETKALIEFSESNDPFGFERLTYIRSVDQSKELNERAGPFIVIAASGMCEAGRVVHHLANSVSNPRNMILIVGYQADQTLGKKLVNREPVVNIFGEPHDLKAQVVVLNSFSAHADRNELLDYIGRFDPKRVKQSFLVHGDLDQAEQLQRGLEGLGFGAVSIPTRGEKAALR
jgi:metallo-beta-lactamase family protein